MHHLQVIVYGHDLQLEVNVMYDDPCMELVGQGYQCAPAVL